MFDPFYTLGGRGTGLFDPFSDWGIPTIWATPLDQSRRQRRRVQRQIGGQQGQQASGGTPAQQPTTGGEMTEAAVGNVAPWTGEDVGFFDFDRMLSEPLVMSLMDRDNEYSLHVSQPPELRKKDLHVEVNNGVLTISGAREMEERGRRRTIVYHRSVTLPDNVNLDGIEAKYKPDNTLDVMLPKVKGTQRKKITIQGAEASKMEEKEKEMGSQEKEMVKEDREMAKEDKEKTKEERDKGQEATTKIDSGSGVASGGTSGGGRQIPTR